MSSTSSSVFPSTSQTPFGATQPPPSMALGTALPDSVQYSRGDAFDESTLKQSVDPFLLSFHPIAPAPPRPVVPPVIGDSLRGTQGDRFSMNETRQISKSTSKHLSPLASSRTSLRTTLLGSEPAPSILPLAVDQQTLSTPTIVQSQKKNDANTDRLATRTTRSGRRFSLSTTSTASTDSSSTTVPHRPRGRPRRASTTTIKTSVDMGKTSTVSTSQARDPKTGVFVSTTARRKRGSTTTTTRTAAPPVTFSIPFFSTPSSTGGETEENRSKEGGRGGGRRGGTKKRTREQAEHSGDGEWEIWREMVGFERDEKERRSYDEVRNMSGRAALRKWGWWKGGEETDEEGVGEPEVEQTEHERELIVGGNLSETGEQGEEEQGGVIVVSPESTESTSHNPALPTRERSSLTEQPEIIVSVEDTKEKTSTTNSARRTRKRNRAQILPAYDLGTRSSTRLALKQSTLTENIENDDRARTRDDGAGQQTQPRPRRSKKAAHSNSSKHTAIESRPEPEDFPLLPSDASCAKNEGKVTLKTIDLEVTHTAGASNEQKDQNRIDSSADERTPDEREVLFALLALGEEDKSQLFLQTTSTGQKEGAKGYEQVESTIDEDKMQQPAIPDTTQARPEDSTEVDNVECSQSITNKPKVKQQEVEEEEEEEEAICLSPDPDCVSYCTNHYSFAKSPSPMDDSLEPPAFENSLALELEEVAQPVAAFASYVPPSPISPDTIYHSSTRLPPTVRYLEKTPSRLAGVSSYSISALANKPEFFPGRNRLPPAPLPRITIPRALGAEIDKVKQEIGEETDLDRKERDVEHLRAQLWGNFQDRDGGRLDPLYCPTFLASKVSRLVAADPLYVPPSFESPLIAPFLSILKPSIGRPPVTRLPLSTKGISNFLPSPLNLAPSPSTSSRSRSSSQRLSPSTFTTLEYLYGRNLDSREVELLETTEPIFVEFVQVMTLVSQVNRGIEKLDESEKWDQKQQKKNTRNQPRRGGGGGGGGGREGGAGGERWTHDRYDLDPSLHRNEPASWEWNRGSKGGGGYRNRC